MSKITSPPWSRSEHRIVMSLRKLLLDAGLPARLITKERLDALLELYIENIGERALIVDTTAAGRVIIPRRLE